MEQLLRARRQRKHRPAALSALLSQGQQRVLRARHRHQKARALREQQLRSILIDFSRALKKASDDARFAGKSAASKASLASARAAAATARDEAVALLGPEPKPPVPPMKPMKSAKGFAPSQKPEKKN